MKTLVIAEHNHQQLTAATLATISAASKITNDITLLISGKNCLAVAEQASTVEKVTAVKLLDDDNYAYFLAENMANLICQVASNYTHIFAPATTFGKNILPRAAAILDVAMISDIIDIENDNTFIRPIYAGNALMTLQSHDAIKMISVRPTAFALAKIQQQHAPIETLTLPLESFAKTRFISTQTSVSARPDLSTAKIVVAGGRGMQSKENFALLEKLADCLNAAIGASRAAVDAEFISNDFQVGQTGKIVAPELYFAIGISGAIQHVAGMKDSKVIVAINKDPDAPIFQIADYGLVADLFVAVPELIQQLQHRDNP